jgi:hypothetical protein
VCAERTFVECLTVVGASRDYDILEEANNFVN